MSIIRHVILSVPIFIVLLFACASLITHVMGQGPVNSLPNKPSSNATTSVSVSATVSLQVSNATLKAKMDMLKSAISNFLNSGPNVLKSSDNDLAAIKTKIDNQINKDTQNVEGSEATNAIIGVELNKALKTTVSGSKLPNQASTVTIITSSQCNFLAGPVMCTNNIVIK